MKRKIPWLAIATVVLTTLCLAVIALGVYGYIGLDSRVRALENQASQSSASDLQSAIDFMKDQMQHLIWLLGVVVAGAGAILAFVGLTTRKAVEEQFKLTYSKLVAAKDTEVFEKQIIFLYKENDDSLTEFQRELRARGYNIKWLRVSNPDVTSKLSGASIVICLVNSGSDILYGGIAEWCESHSVHCIFYCPKNRLSDDVLQKGPSYVSTSIQIAKLRESVYTLLYLAS